MTSVSGLADDDAAGVATEFGVSAEQVRRDHLVSLILAALTPEGHDLVFFGGTALARTHLPHGRLSEDIDLIAMGSRKDVAARIEQTLMRALLPTYGRTAWAPSLTSVRDTDPALLQTDDGLSVRVQLLRAEGYEPWPTEISDLHQRYRGAPAARLRVPTLESFVAWKTVTWMDRAAARDLYDLWGLAELGAMTASAAALFAKHGPVRQPPQGWMFGTAPTDEDWLRHLGGQTRVRVGPDDALSIVRNAWDNATGSASD
jgi:hypothetical protein